MHASVVSKPTASSEEMPISKGPAKLISLALQGGSAHGAFIRGVLDRRIEDHVLAPEKIPVSPQAR